MIELLIGTALAVGVAELVHRRERRRWQETAEYIEAAFDAAEGATNHGITRR